MASRMYSLAKQSLLSQSPSIDLDTDTIKIALVGSGYAPNTATNGDQYYSVIGTHAQGTPQTMKSKSVTGGVFDAADVTFTAVATNANQITQLVIYKDTLTASNSPLICVIDSASAGLPITPNGGDITVSFDNGTNKIFRLADV
jgi:hypothetical protein